MVSYVGGGKYQEPLTVSNAANSLLQLSDKWIVVASSLGVPSSAIDVINVSSRRDDQVALRKVVEWWFMNTANPEWNQVYDILIKVCCIHVMSDYPPVVLVNNYAGFFCSQYKFSLMKQTNNISTSLHQSDTKKMHTETFL